MAVLALAFGAALLVLMAVVIRGVATSRRSGWAARTDGSGDSTWMVMGSDGGGGSDDGSGADCGSSDGGGGCDAGGGDGGGGGD